MPACQATHLLQTLRALETYCVTAHTIYTLPPCCGPVLVPSSQAQERAARAVASKARDEARKEREAQRAQHAARKAPTSVIMSDKQRQ
jgi:hypothetical protein